MDGASHEQLDVANKSSNSTFASNARHLPLIPLPALSCSRHYHYFPPFPPPLQGLEGLDQYFAMARSVEGASACDMSKFFDTNYHFIVPELSEGMGE